MSTTSATAISKLNNEEERRKKILRIPKFLKSIGKKASISPGALNPAMTENSNPPETVESLQKYEKKPGQAQKFLDRMGQNFRWPVSMNDCDRRTAFFNLADDNALEFDDEVGLNLISFFDKLDKGTFDEHKDCWVLLYKQEVKKYGSEYSSEELECLEDEMPGAVYLPVDKSRLVDVEEVATRTVRAQRTGNEHMVGNLLVKSLY